MSVVTNAGMGPVTTPVSSRKEAVREIARKLRNSAATEDETVEALEAVLELSRMPED